MPYPQNYGREGVNVLKVREALETAKDNPLTILQYLENCMKADNATIAAIAARHKRQMIEAGNSVATYDAYEFMFKSADYIADHDLLHMGG